MEKLVVPPSSPISWYLTYFIFKKSRLPWWLSDKKNPPGNAGDVALIPELGRSLVKEWQPTPVLLPEKSPGQRSLVGTVHEVNKESDMT